MDIIFQRLSTPQDSYPVGSLVDSRTISSPTDIVSPISSLPEDVLRRIFEEGTFGGDLKDAVMFPVNLASVSHNWRETALAFHKLWSTIIVTSPSGIFPTRYKDRNPQTALPWVTCSLQRSHGHPLSIYIDLRNEEYQPTLFDEKNVDRLDDELACDMPNVLAPLLRPHASRFKEFVFLSDTFFPIAAILPCFLVVQMPRLEALNIQRDNMCHAFAEDFKPRFLQNTLKYSPTIAYPKLKHLTIGGLPLAWPSLTFGSLRCLTLTYIPFSIRPTFEVLMRILITSANSLQRLDIQGALPRNEFTPSNYLPAVWLPNLHELVIGYTFPQEMLPIIHSLEMPNLKKLSIIDMVAVVPFNSLPDGIRDKNQLEREQARDASCCFQALVKVAPFPLHELEELTLRSVIVLPAGLGTPEMPLGFFLRLTSLKTLTLHDTDQHTRHALNTPVQNWGPHPQTHALVFPCTTVTHLHFRATSLRYIVSFLRARTCSPNGQTCLVPMLEELTMDAGDLDMNVVHQLRSIGINIWHMTRKFDARPDDLPADDERDCSDSGSDYEFDDDLFETEDEVYGDTW